MFRLPKINIDSEDKFKATLMKNRRESLGEINNKDITKVTRHLEEIDSFELKVPKYILRDNKKVFNSMYLKIAPRQQIIVETIGKDGNIKKERFIISEKQRERNKDKGDKTFKVMSFESTLKNKRCTFEGKVFQLKSDETIISEGIVDKFAKDTGWGIGYIDPKSKVETIKGVETVKVDLFQNYKNDKVTDKELLWEKDVTTTIGAETPLYLSITYGSLKAYDSKDKVLYTDNITTTITEPLYTNIKKIKAYHHSMPNARYSIRYVFTLVDNVEVERICSFMNIINKKITADEIFLTWETGKLIEKEHIKIINVEGVDDNWFDSMVDFAGQFNSIALYDTYDKKINIIHKDNIGKNAPYLLSFDSNIININVTENANNYPNALKIIGKDGISISSENMFGGDIIYDMAYYKRMGIMSDELSDAWDKYIKLLEVKQKEWYLLSNQRYSVQGKKTQADSECKSLTDRIKYLKNLLSAYIAEKEKDKQEQTKTEIEALEGRLNECLANIKKYQDELDSIDEDMKVISNDIKKENATDNNEKIFTSLDLEELNDMEVVAVHQDDYYSTPYGLLENSKQVLHDMTNPSIDFKVDIKNLIKLTKQKINKILILGDLFLLEDDELINEIGDGNRIRLVGYEYEPALNKVSNAIFTNKTRKNNNLRNLNNIGKQVNTSGNTIRSFKDVWEDSKLSNNIVNSFVNGGLDLAAQQARGKGTRNYITIDECGIMMEDQTDRNRCMFLSSGLLCLSTDGFKTSKVAITPDAVMADVIAGKILLGTKVEITTDDGQFVIGMSSDKTRTGLFAKDSSLQDRIFLGLEKNSDGVQVAKLELKSKDGKRVVFSDEGILQTNQNGDERELDPKHPLTIDWYVSDGTNRIDTAKLLLKCKRFRSTTRGGEFISKAAIVPSGGGSTSGGGGAYYHSESKSSHGASWNTIGDYVPVTEDPPGSYYFELGYLKHIHYTDITFSTPDHYHTTPNHWHPSIDLSHIHPEIWGITEDTLASNLVVRVNGEIVASGLNGVSEINIANKLKIGQWNEITIESFTNGAVSWSLFTKTFDMF